MDSDELQKKYDKKNTNKQTTIMRYPNENGIQRVENEERKKI